jgi:glyoxylase-like metal-dependent hydrolase (beta-lactamase superfamily II)
MHLGRDRVICCWEIDGVLVDPGPQTCMDTLVEALGGNAPQALLLTHIHLDHAGTVGSLVERWPELPVYVHEVGAPHVADPSKLVASATRLYGEDGMKTLWGDILPVPAGNIHALSGGETILDRFEVAYTPGHASHHVAYLNRDSGWAYVGDVTGVRIEPESMVLAPTPPPDIDIAAWKGSLDKVKAWQPTTLALTHFGAFTNVDDHLNAVSASLDELVGLFDQNDQQAFSEALASLIERQVGPLTGQYTQAAPVDLYWLGLERWNRKLRDHSSVHLT